MINFAPLISINLQGCFLWFLSFPLLILFATIFAEYVRHKVYKYNHVIVIAHYLVPPTHTHTISTGCDSRRDNRSDVCHDFAKSAVSLSQPLLGGVHALLHHPPSAERQRGRGRLPHKLRMIIIIIIVK